MANLGILGQSLSGGTLNPVPPNASREQQITAINDIINRLNAILKTQTYSDGQTKRFVMGYQKSGWPGGDFGMKISLPGVDIDEAGEKGLLFSWDFTTGQQSFRNDAGKEMTVIDTKGITTVDPNSGIYRNRFGVAGRYGRPGVWTSVEGKDLKVLIDQ